MYITSVKKIKKIQKNIDIPRVNYEITYLSLDKSVNLTDIISSHNLRGIKNLIVLPMMSINVQKNQTKYITPKKDAKELLQLYRKSDNINIPFKTHLIRTSSKKTSTIIDLSPILHKLSSVLGTLQRRTSYILESFLKLSQTSNNKVLILSITNNDQTRFFDALLKDLIRAKDKEHSLFQFQYLVLHVYSKEHSFSELYVINIENVKKSQIISLLRYTKQVLKTLSKIDDNTVIQSFNRALQIIKQVNSQLIDSLKKLSTSQPDLFKSISIKIAYLMKTVKDKAKLKTMLLALINDELSDYIGVDNGDEVEIDEKNEVLPIQTKANNTDELVKRVIKLLKMVPSGVDRTDPVTTKPGLQLLERDDIHVGNIFNTTESQEEYIKFMLELYNETYWNKMKYDVTIESTEIIENIHADTYDKIIRYKFRIKDKTGRVHRLELDLPYFNDGFVRLGTGEYVLQHQLYQTPIVSFNNHEIMLRTNYSAIRVQLLTKNKIKFLETHVLGTKVPSIFILLLLTCSLSETLRYLNIKKFTIDNVINYNISDKNVFQISEEYVLVVNQNIDSFQRNALFGLKHIRTLLNKIKVKNIDQFDTCKYWDNIGVLLTSVRFIESIKKFPNVFIDPLTKTLLKIEDYPTEFIPLYIELMKRAHEGKVIENTDLSYRRVRDLEVLSILMFKTLNQSILVHDAALEGKNKKLEMKLDRDRIVKSLQVDPVLSQQFVLIGQDYNPVAYTQFKTRATYGGMDGPSYVGIQQRSIHPSYKCIIDPVDTPEGENAGAVQQFSLSANIKNMVGTPDKGDTCYMFSTATSLIPFVVYNDGNRVQMAANQLRQNIPLKYAERPLIATGMEPLIARITSDRFVVRCQITGKVTKVTDDYIIVTGKNDVVHRLEKFYDRFGYSKPKPIVEEGDKVKKGQVIAENPYFFKNGFYSFGVNARVAFLNYMGINTEDGIIISESFAKKLTSIHMTKPRYSTIYITPGMTIKHIRLEKGSVKSGEELVVLQMSEGDMNLIPDYIKMNITIRNTESKNIEVVLPTLESGTITDIKVYASNKTILDNYPELKKYVQEYKNQIKERVSGLNNKDLTIEHKRILKDTMRLKKSDINTDYIIVFYEIEYESPAVLGDKLHNRHGNKGVISKILPDEKMPKGEDGKPFDILFNPFGILGRKNIGQLIECQMGKFVLALKNKIEKLINENKLREIEKLLVDVYNIIDKSYAKKIKNIFNDKELAKQFLEEIKTNGFSLIIPNDKRIELDDIDKLLKLFNIKKTEKVYIPELGTYASNNVVTGYLYVSKLEQRSITKYSARATGRYVTKTLQPPSGREEGGQRSGVYDVYSLLGYPMSETLTEMLTALSDDHESKQELIDNIIRKGNTNLKNPDLSTSKLLKMYLLGLHVLRV